MTQLRGQFLNVVGQYRNGELLRIMPMFTPAPVGSNVVVSNVIEVTLDSQGRFGYAGTATENFSLYPGSYRFVLSDTDTLIVLVPDEVGMHEVADLVTYVGSTPENLRPATNSAVTASSLMQITSQDSLVYPSLGNDASDFPGIRVVFTQFTAEAAINVQYLLAAIRAMSYGGDYHLVTLGDGNPTQSPASLTTWLTWLSSYLGGRLTITPGATDFVAPDGLSAINSYIPNPTDHKGYGTMRLGPVLFIFISSSANEPDGNSSTSTQADWVRAQLAASSARCNILVLNKAPRSRAWYGPVGTPTPYDGSEMAWVENLGADFIIGGTGIALEYYNGPATPSFVAGGSLGLTYYTTPYMIGLDPSPEYPSTYANQTFGFLALFITSSGIRFELRDYDFYQDNSGVDAPALYTLNYTFRSNTARAVMRLRLPPYASGFRIAETDSDGPFRLALDTGPGDGQLLSGWTLFQNIHSGRIVPMATIPDPETILANPFLQNCLYMVGDDPPTMYYFNKALQEVMVWGSPSAGNTTQIGPGSVLPLTPAPVVTAYIGRIHLERDSTDDRVFMSYGGTGSTYTEVTAQFISGTHLETDIPVALLWDGIQWLSFYTQRDSCARSNLVTVTAKSLRKVLGLEL